MKQVFVDELKPGERIETEFAVGIKSLRELKGEPFITFELFDKTGKIDAVYWGGDSPFVSDEIKEGTILRITGTVQTYKGKNQIKIDKIKVAGEGEYDISDFIASSPIPIEELWGSFLRGIEEIGDPNLRALFGLILSDEKMVRNLKEAPGGKKWHHSYRGGLLEHSLAVCRIALIGIKPYPTVDRDMVIAGALLHDIGKVKELTYDILIDFSEEGRLLGHIVLGALIVEDYIAKLENFPASTRKKLLHIIVSHHGDTLTGSPVKPMTVEAEVIYHADQLDAQANAFNRIIMRESAEGKTWSDYVHLKERYLYLL